MRHIESNIQQACVAWFRIQHRRYSKLLFAVPNGGWRRRVEAAIMMSEGVTPGVSDLLLLIARGGYHGMCIEMKTQAKSSRQTDSQREWQTLVEEQGYLYVVCRSLEQFREEITKYLAL